jgi:hypothetical protein
MNDIKTLNTVVSMALGYIFQVKEFTEEQDVEIVKLYGAMFEELSYGEAVVINDLTVKESVEIVFDFYKKLKNTTEVN